MKIDLYDCFNYDSLFKCLCGLGVFFNLYNNVVFTKWTGVINMYRNRRYDKLMQLHGLIPLIVKIRYLGNCTFIACLEIKPGYTELLNYFWIMF